MFLRLSTAHTYHSFINLICALHSQPLYANFKLLIYPQYLEEHVIRNTSLNIKGNKHEYIFTNFTPTPLNSAGL